MVESCDKMWSTGESESEVTQSCPTLCDPMDCSLPGSSVHEILQARILEWVAISFSRGPSQPRDQTRVSCIGGRCFNLWATREGPLEKGMANCFNILALRTPWTVWKGKKIRHWKMNTRVSRYAVTTGEEQRSSSRKNEMVEPKQKWYQGVDVSGDVSKVPFCKEDCCIGNWNVRSMNQGKLEVIKEMARVSIDILGISELMWMGMVKFNSDERHNYYCGLESLRRNGIILIVNRRVRNAVLGCNLKNDRMIFVLFQGKPFNITVIQVYAQTIHAEEA